MCNVYRKLLDFSFRLLVLCWGDVSFLFHVEINHCFLVFLVIIRFSWRFLFVCWNSFIHQLCLETYIDKRIFIFINNYFLCWLTTISSSPAISLTYTRMLFTCKQFVCIPIGKEKNQEQQQKIAVCFFIIIILVAMVFLFIINFLHVNSQFYVR